MFFFLDCIDPRESSPKESPSPLPRRVITPVQEESLYAEVIHTQLCIRESNSAIGQFSSNNPPPPRSPGNSGRRGSSLVVTEQSGKSPAVSRKTAVKPAPPPKPTPPPRPPKPSQTKQREAQVYGKCFRFMAGCTVLGRERKLLGSNNLIM